VAMHTLSWEPTGGPRPVNPTRIGLGEDNRRFERPIPVKPNAHAHPVETPVALTGPGPLNPSRSPPGADPREVERPSGSPTCT